MICRMFGHTWGDWSKVKLSLDDLSYQTRTCEYCGLVKRRFL